MIVLWTINRSWHNRIARYTLFANNSKIGVKRRKTDVRRIVYKRHSPCFTNRFFAVRCTQFLHGGSGLVGEHKLFFRRKKSSAVRKLTANNEQCTAIHLSRFRQQYFIRRKNNSIPYSSCSRIVYSGLMCRTAHGMARQCWNGSKPEQILIGLELEWPLIGSVQKTELCRTI